MAGNTPLPGARRKTAAEKTRQLSKERLAVASAGALWESLVGCWRLAVLRFDFLNFEVLQTEVLGCLGRLTGIQMNYNLMASLFN